MTAWTRNLLNEALRYFHNGLFVIPLWDPQTNLPSKATKWAEKEEIVKLTEKPLTEEQVVQWWTRWPSANIGIVTGPVSGVIVLDLDPDKAAEEGRDVAEIRRIIESSPFCVQTGREQGLHGWFAYDPLLEWIGLSRPTKPMNGPLRIGKGLDLPWYVVAPPSIHPETGKLYGWKDRSLFDVPKHHLPKPPSEFYRFERLDAEGSPDIEKKWIVEALSTVQTGEGERNNSLVSLAGYLIEHHPKDIVVAILKNWNAANLHVPLREREISNCVDSVKRTRDRKIWRRDIHWEPPRVDFPTQELFADNPVVFDYIDGLSKRANLDPSMIGLSVFAAASTCMQGRYHIHCIDEWEVPPTFFALVGCPTGTRKGIPYKNILRVLEPSLQYLKNEHGTQMDIYLREEEIKSLEKIQKKRTDLSDSTALLKMRQSLELLRKYIKPFIPFYDHGSPEGIRDLLIDQKQVSIYAEEGRAFFEKLVFSSDSSNAHVYIRAYDGKIQSRNLVGRGYAESDGATLLMLFLMIQNEVMEELFMEQPGKKPHSLDSQGFLPRFLFSMPQKYNAVIQSSTDASSHFEEACSQLSQIFLDIVRSPEKEAVYQGSNEFIKRNTLPFLVKHPQKITFSPDALKVLSTFQEFLNKQSEQGYPLSPYVNWINRASTHAAKIAAFLHHLKTPGTFEPIPLTTAQKAISFIEHWAIPHMKIAYAKMSFNESGRDAQNLWKTFVKKDVSQMQAFTYKQVSDTTRNWSKRKIRVQEALEYLHKEGFIKPVRVTEELTYPNQSFECNPYVRF